MNPFGRLYRSSIRRFFWCGRLRFLLLSRTGDGAGQLRQGHLLSCCKNLQSEIGRFFFFVRITPQFSLHWVAEFKYLRFNSFSIFLVWVFLSLSLTWVLLVLYEEHQIQINETTFKCTVDLNNIYLYYVWRMSNWQFHHYTNQIYFFWLEVDF